MKVFYFAFVLTSVSLTIGLEDIEKEFDVACIEGMMSDPSADVNSIIDACQSQEDEREVSDVSEDPLKLTGEESDENDITANYEVKANDDKGLDEDAGGEKQTSGGSFRPKGCSLYGRLPPPIQKAFTPACNSYDYCYHYKRQSRLDCDMKFVLELVNICRRRAKSIVGKLDFGYCYNQAMEFYDVVHHFRLKYYG